jgi:hypothetical protein
VAQRGAALVPAARDVALTLADLELRAGETGPARTLLAHLSSRSHGDPLADRERPAIERVREKAGLPPPGPVDTRHLEARLGVAAPLDGARVRSGGRPRPRPTQLRPR